MASRHRERSSEGLPEREYGPITVINLGSLVGAEIRCAQG